MWMRLTERMREFIPKVGCRMLKRTVCNCRPNCAAWIPSFDKTVIFRGIVRTLAWGHFVECIIVTGYFCP